MENWEKHTIKEYLGHNERTFLSLVTPDNFDMTTSLWDSNCHLLFPNSQNLIKTTY